MARMQKRFRKPRVVAKNCPFCADKSKPDYKDVDVLSRYMSERGMILSADRTGLCSSHQRQVTRAIKRARHVALLPFVVRV